MLIWGGQEILYHEFCDPHSLSVGILSAQYSISLWQHACCSHPAMKSLFWLQA